MRLVGKNQLHLEVYQGIYSWEQSLVVFYERELIEQREQKLGVIIPGDSRKQ